MTGRETDDKALLSIGITQVLQGGVRDVMGHAGYVLVIDDGQHTYRVCNDGKGHCSQRQRLDGGLSNMEDKT